MAMRMNDSLDESGELHEINVTPFIDVMLVLLIIFMVAAPLATVDIKVDLPASSAVPQPRPEKPVFLTVKADNQLYVGDQPVDRETLATALDKVTQSNKETTIFFQADKVVDYETLMSVMDALRKSGYLKVGLVGMEAGSSGANIFASAVTVTALASTLVLRKFQFLGQYRFLSQFQLLGIFLPTSSSTTSARSILISNSWAFFAR